MRKILLVAAIFVFAGITPLYAEAQFVGQSENFFVDKEYDREGREKTHATLLKISEKALIYVDGAWWDGLVPFSQNEMRGAIDALTTEFDNAIYPKLTLAFGGVRVPGIDGRDRVTILLHPMQENAGGYTRYSDGYDRLQIPGSNMREMIYLNTDFLGTEYAKNFLAHEFIHVITFNQKNVRRNVFEDTWLNEARAEYAPMFLGYESMPGGTLKGRVDRFIRDPSISLLEWTNTEKDYAMVSLFAQYLVDQYGLNVLVDSLHDSSVGANSLHYALAKNGYQETFESVFSNWIMTALLNDCLAGERLCYKNELLQDMRIVPQSNFLPVTGTSTLSLLGSVKDWSARWYRIIGGSGALKVEFQGNPQALFRVLYVLEDLEGGLETGSFEMDWQQKSVVNIPNFGDYRSITIIPSSQTNMQRTENVPAYQFLLTLSTSASIREPEQPELSSPDPVLSTLSSSQIRAILSLLRSFGAGEQIVRNVEFALGGRQGSPALGFNRNLIVGLSGEDVRQLQQALNKNEATMVAQMGPGSPGNETIFFGPLTQNAVIRFQELYATEVLLPLGLTSGTGFVGPATREKLITLLSLMLW